MNKLTWRFVLLLLISLVRSGGAWSADVPGSTPLDTVARLYHDFAWEAVIITPFNDSDSLLDAPASVLGRYFDDAVVKLWLRDRKCGLPICRMDFTPIWNGQDPLNASVQIRPTSDPQVVKVSVSYPNGETDLSYSLARTARGWRITDIKSPRWSLVEILTKPLE